MTGIAFLDSFGASLRNQLPLLVRNLRPTIWTNSSWCRNLQMRSQVESISSCFLGIALWGLYELLRNLELDNVSARVSPSSVHDLQAAVDLPMLSARKSFRYAACSFGPPSWARVFAVIVEPIPVPLDVESERTIAVNRESISNHVGPRRASAVDGSLVIRNTEWLSYLVTLFKKEFGKPIILGKVTWKPRATLSESVQDV